MGRMQNKVCVITGGAGGLGSEIARLMLKEGAKVVITDLPQSQGVAVAKQLGCDFMPLDVTSEREWQSFTQQAASKYGTINVLVNAAGVEGNVLESSPESTTYEEWRRVHSINLDGVFLGCRAVLPYMKQVGAGSIVNISSVVAYFGSPLSVAYGSSKAGVQQFSKSMALYGSRDNQRVRCNSVHPGVIRTRMLNNIYASIAKMAGITAEAAEQSSLRAIPFGEVGEPEDVGYLVLYLASDESKYVTGSEFVVDGGWHLVDAK